MSSIDTDSPVGKPVVILNGILSSIPVVDGVVLWIYRTFIGYSSPYVIWLIISMTHTHTLSFHIILLSFLFHFYIHG